MSKIFVSIACFMDTDIVNTIKDCLAKAHRPNNLSFGICLQCEDTDDYLSEFDNNPQFKIMKMNWKDAKGPAFARSIIYDMFSDEDFYFQIDCHTRFYKNWDTIIVDCFHRCKKINNRAIISHYPVNIKNMYKCNNQIANISTVRCVDKNMGIKTHGRYVDISSCPLKSWGISSAMLFFDKAAHKAVPFDKSIYFGLQFEEQVVLAARYWTHGYDIFTPDSHIIGTEYITNRKRQKRCVIKDYALQNNTYERLCHVMKLDFNEKFKYDDDSGLGSVRTIEDYYKMLKIFDKIKKVFPSNVVGDDVGDDVGDVVGDDVGDDVDELSESVIINMKDARDKYIIMCRKLVLFNISFKRFNAVNGKEIYNEYNSLNYINNKDYLLRPHQVGCWQSHYQIWQSMVTNNIQQLLIFEDDCLFVNDFKLLYEKTLNIVKNKDYDILYFGYSGTNIVLNNDLHLLNYGMPRCTHCYMITLNGAKKLLKELKILTFPLDEMIGRLFYKKQLIGYRTSYILVYQPWQRKKDKYPLPEKYKNGYDDLI